MKKIYTPPAGRRATKSYKQTQKFGEKFAKEILLSRTSQKLQKTAVVIGLSGSLGAGKTTFLQGFAKGLGIKEKILSPTFVIIKKFNFHQNVRTDTLVEKCFYHIDAYRFKNSKDILELGWEKIISDPKNIVAIEWSERIKKLLPKNTIFIEFRIIDNSKREIEFKP